jgi:ABC-type multidrug transport system fused ATPase/permease subunit
MISIIAEVVALVSMAPRRGWIIILISIISPLIQTFSGSLQYKSSIILQSKSNASDESDITDEKSEYTEHASRAETMKSFAYSISMRPEVILLDLRDWVIKEYQRSSAIITEMEEPTDCNSFRQQIYEHVTNLIQNGSRAIMYLLVAFRSDYLGIPLSILIYLEQSSQSLFLKIWGLWNRIEYVLQDMMAIRELFECMEMQPNLKVLDDTAVYNAVRSDNGIGMKIEFRGVSYKYPGKQEFVLKEVSFVLEAGETMALLGFNGSGIARRGIS